MASRTMTLSLARRGGFAAFWVTTSSAVIVASLPGAQHDFGANVALALFAGRRILGFDEAGFERDHAVLGSTGAMVVVEDPFLERAPVSLGLGDAAYVVVPPLVLLEVRRNLLDGKRG